MNTAISLGQRVKNEWRRAMPKSFDDILSKFTVDVTDSHPACRVYFPLHPARYEPVSTYLGPHSRRTHVPLVRHPPSLDSKANRNAPAIRGTFWPGNIKPSDSIREAMRELGQRCSNIVTASMIMAQR